VAGFLIGILQHGMDLGRALQTYTVLTIGDGLVTVIPALMISVSGGLIVTRGGADSRLGAEFRKQVFGAPEPLLLASGVLVALAAFPGLPKIPFLLLGGGLGTAAWRMRQRALAEVKPPVAAKPAQATDTLENLLKVEPLAIEVGLGLVRYVDGGANSPLLRRIAAIRRQLASELGYVLPAVRVTDNLTLGSREYVVMLKGDRLARFELVPGCELAIPAGKAEPLNQGQSTREPAFGMPAWWIAGDKAELARASGYTVVDPVTVLGTHLAELIRRYAYELFSRQDTKKLLDRVAAENPKIVEDLVPKLLPMAAVQRVLQNLLRERVTVRDGASILEALGEAAGMTRNPVLLTEYVRQTIRRTVVRPYLNHSGDLPAYFVDAAIEQVVESAVEHGEQGSHLGLAPQMIRDIVTRFEGRIGSASVASVAVTGSASRYFLRQIMENSGSNVFFLSHSEVPPGVKVISLGMIK
jgi:flagellar biosynthesis protein FlhA